MKTATLMVNHAAGSARMFASRLAQLEAMLRAAGYEPALHYTTPSADAVRHFAREAAKTSQLVIACGGDGTVHAVVQGLAGTDVALGVLPLGTANALARNLQLPMEPLAAMQRLLTYVPVRVPLGVAETTGGQRYFLIMAGCGPDGALVHGLSSEYKSKFGRRAYYRYAARLFLTRRWPAFFVEWRAGDKRGSTRAVGLMASRVANLGGAFSGLTTQATLTSDRLQIKLLRPPAQLSFPAWFSLSRLGLPNPWLTTLDVEEVRCTLSESAVYVQADAEPLGVLPVTLRLVPSALTLLMPSRPWVTISTSPDSVSRAAL